MGKGERRKQEILDAASLLFFKRGYKETTVQDILDSLSCSKGCFYHHFESKLNVLTEIARELADKSYADFLLSDQGDALQALNTLLLHASPLRWENLGLLQSLIALEYQQEGAVLAKAIQDASADMFYPYYCVILERLRQEDRASYSGDAAMQLCWHSFICGCMLIIRETSHLKSDAAFPHAILLLRAVRRQFEDALGLLPGSVGILKAVELGEILSAAINV